MDNRKKIVERMQDISVSLRIPPGDFRKVKIDDSLQMNLSHDLAEFMSACKGQPAKFYICVKFYLSERRGLHKMMKSNTKGRLGMIEASLNATLISLMTIAVTNQMDSDVIKVPKKHKKRLRGAIQDLKRALKSERNMISFDKYCDSLYGVQMVNVMPNGFDDDDDSIAFDTHIQAES